MKCNRVGGEIIWLENCFSDMFCVLSLMRLKQQIFAIIALLAVSSTANSQLAGLASDSARAAQYWGYLQAGDTASAQAALEDNQLPSSPMWEELANFLTAYVAYADSNFTIVPTLLELGVTDELTEHAAWLRGKAMASLGQSHLAGIYWRRLLYSDLPDYRELAIDELFKDAKTLGKLDTLQTLSQIAKVKDVSRELRQQIDLEISVFLSRANRHAEAAEKLRATYLLSPATSYGKQAKELLDQYPVRYGYTPPQPGWDGEWEEVERLEKTGQKAQAFDKIVALRKRGRYAANDELLIARQVRLAVALRRHSDAQTLSQQHIKQFPTSTYRDEMRFSLVRAAYLTDQDDLAIKTANELARTGTNTKHIGESWRLIGLLHIDRDRPADAAIAFDKWYSAVAGGEGADDALWNRGWARFLSGNYEQAGRDFENLVRSYPKSGYVIVGTYWAARAYTEAGKTIQSDSLCNILLSRYPYSYYAQLSCSINPRPDPERHDLHVLSLEQLAALGGKHTRAFAQLTALGLWEFALREWPQVEAECGQRADVAWWRPVLYWNNGERFQAWRWIIKELRDEAASFGERPDDFFKLWYPLDYEPLILDLCSQYQVDPYLALGVICQESHFDDGIVSPSGAIGLMQLMPSTAKEQALRIGQTIRDEELFVGPRNLGIGVAHLADLMNDLKGDTVLTLCAYNAGINAARRWQNEFGHVDRDVFVERIPYRETRLYVKHILQHMAAYRRLYPDLKLSIPRVEP